MRMEVVKPRFGGTNEGRSLPICASVMEGVAPGVSSERGATEEEEEEEEAFVIVVRKNASSLPNVNSTTVRSLPASARAPRSTVALSCD